MTIGEEFFAIVSIIKLARSPTMMRSPPVMTVSSMVGFVTRERYMMRIKGPLQSREFGTNVHLVRIGVGPTLQIPDPVRQIRGGDVR